MSSIISSVIIASASSTAKVFLLGLLGYLSVQYPSSSPFIPPSSIASLARMSFHLLMVPLFYATIASTVTMEDMGTLWSIPLGGVVVIGVSYFVCGIMKRLMCLDITKDEDEEEEESREEEGKRKKINQGEYDALSIAASFPNVVSLPILIFPSLCEYDVVHTTFYNGGEEDGGDVSRLDMIRECVDTSNTMVFLYFFIWSVVFFMWGNFVLLRSVEKKKRRQKEEEERQQQQQQRNNANSEEDKTNISTAGNNNTEMNGSSEESAAAAAEETFGDENLNSTNNSIIQINESPSILTTIKAKLKPILRIIYKSFLSSPGFIAMALGFITVCIPPLQSALFEPGGALRFLGGALETLGVAASSFSNIVVAASLHLQSTEKEEKEEDIVGRVLVEDDFAENGEENNEQMEQQQSSDDNTATTLTQRHNTTTQVIVIHNDNNQDERRINRVASHPNIMTDPNIGFRNPPPQRRKITRRNRSSLLLQLQNSDSFLARRSSRALTSLTNAAKKQPASLRIQLWFILSRLILTPAIVLSILVGMDCGGLFATYPNFLPGPGKLILLLNSALPGALTIVVILKSKKESAKAASLVASVYLPSYIVSIVSVAGWSVAGLMISIPREDGSSFCGR